MACAADDISISVQAKRYVSSLWSNIKSHPYTTLFPEDLRGEDVLKIWRLYKICEDEVRTVRQGFDKEKALILTHGDRFIAHCTFQFMKNSGTLFDDVQFAASIADEVALGLPQIFVKKTSSYPATAFKNQKIQEELKNAVLNALNDAH